MIGGAGIMGLLFLLGASLGSAQAWTVNTNQNGLPLNWPAGQVGWTLNANGNHALDPMGLQTAMEEAAGQWNDIEDSNIDLAYLGATTTAAIDYTDNQNVIYFENEWELDSSLLAVTYVWSLDDGTIMASIWRYTSDHVWGTDGAADVNDLHNTVTHEFGHAVGLAHSDVDASCTNPRMKETTKRDISTDDEHGMISLRKYGLPTGTGLDHRRRLCQFWFIGCSGCGGCGPAAHASHLSSSARLIFRL